MLVVARSIDPGHKRLDLHTTGQRRARIGAHVRKCHRESVWWGRRGDGYKMTMIRRYDEVPIQRAVWLEVVKGSQEGAPALAWAVQQVAHRAQV